MYSYGYGDQAGSSAAKPVCWGRDFSDGNAECRGCPFLSSCKDHIIRSNVNRPGVPQAMPAPVPMYPQQVQPMYQAYPVPMPQQAMVPVQQMQPSYVRPAPPPPPQPQYRTQQAVQQQPQAPLVPTQFANMPPQDWYGKVQDPLFLLITTAPPLMRPQMVGETYAQRWIKNVGLSMMEAALAHTFLAVRQLFLPPAPPDPNTPVDINMFKPH